MGSARPARRLDALRALGDGRVRPAFADRTPSVCFRVPSEVLRGTPAPPRRPCGRAACGALFLGLSCRTTRAGAVDPHDGRGSAPPASHVRGFYPHRGVHHRPSRCLAAPERPSACLLEAFSSRRSDVLPDVDALLAFTRRFERFSGKRSDAGDFRALVSARIRSVHPIHRGRIPERPDASMPPRGSPPSSIRPRRPGVALWSRALPVHGSIGRRLDRSASSGLADRLDRFAPLGATGSFGVFHLTTVADSFRPTRGASS